MLAVKTACWVQQKAKKMEKQGIEPWSFEMLRSENANSTRYHCAISPVDVSFYLRYI
jgi:hypothetical protein